MKTYSKLDFLTTKFFVLVSFVFLFQNQLYSGPVSKTSTNAPQKEAVKLPILLLGGDTACCKPMISGTFTCADSLGFGNVSINFGADSCLNAFKKVYFQISNGFFSGPCGLTGHGGSSPCPSANFTSNACVGTSITINAIVFYKNNCPPDTLKLKIPGACQCFGIGGLERSEPTGTENGFHVFPNPVTSALIVVVPESLLIDHTARIVVSDLMGKTCATKEVTSANSNIEVEGLASGIYFWQIISDGKCLKYGRVIKAKSN